MADQLERAFRECEQRGSSLGATALLERVETRLNDEVPSPFAVSRRASWWSAVPGPAIAAAAALAVLIVVIGGVWLLGGFGSVEIEPIEEPTPTTTAVTTTLPPSTTMPAQALEAPWVESGEIRIGSTVITQRSLSAKDGSVLLEYDLTSLSPVGTAWADEEGGEPVPPVLPERWELETTDDTFEGTSSPRGRSVRFEIDEVITLGEIEAIRLTSWRTIVPVTYDFEIDAEARATVLLPDGSAVGVSRVLETDSGVLVSFDVTLPPDHRPFVPCGDIRLLGSKCIDPVPGTGWTIRESDSDFQVGAEPGTPLDAIRLRYRRPMWVRAEGSIELPLVHPDISGLEPADFPDGYVPISEFEAVKPTVVSAYGDQLLVSMTSVSRRGVAPGSFDPFMGGRWVLETASGDTLDSIGMVFNDRVDGAFTVMFPLSGDEPVAMRLVETWVPAAETGTADAGPVDSVVGSLDDAPVDVVLGNGMVVVVERFDIEGVGGYGTWYVPGDEPLPIIADVTGAFVDRDGTSPVATESWAAQPRHFGLANTGRLFWFWVTSDLVDDDGLAVLPEGEHRFEVRVDAEVPIPIPTDVAIDLTDVPID